MSTSSRRFVIPGLNRPLNRRQVMVGGSALAVAGLVSRLPTLAQQSPATPSASAPGAASPAGAANAQASATPAAAKLPTVPPELTQYANDWPAPQGDITNHRAAKNSSINSSNVTKLDVAWSFPVKATGGFGGMTCTPIVAGKNVFVQDMQSNVFALDRDSGNVVWEKDYNVPSEGPNGVSIGYGMIYGSTGDNREVFALDAASGKEVWRTILSGNTREGIDMAPAVYNRMVFISTVPGNSQAFYEGGARGVLFALDAANGQILWEFYTTEPDLWGDPSVNSGGGSWYPPAIDQDGNLFFDIANPAPFEQTPINGTPVVSGSTRPGPNLYTDCMVKLAPNGALQWYYDANPHDIQDHDLQQSPMLATIDNNGNPYTLAICGGKLGKVIAIDAASGNAFWTIKVGEHNQYDDTQWFPPGGSFTSQPAVIGGIESPMAYDNGTAYVPVFNGKTAYTSTGVDITSLNLADSTGEFVAIDVATGTVKWDAKLPAGNVSGATVCGDVVFGGALDGIVRAYSASDGTLLWSFQTGAGLNAPFAVAGDLLVVPAAGAKLTGSNYAPEATPVAGNVTGPAVIGFKVKS